MSSREETGRLATGITTIGTVETRNDGFYRYKREIIKIRFLSKKGIQTEIYNLDLISKQLKVKIKDVSKEFSKKLGAMVKGNMLAGSFSIEILEDVLQSFIEREVLCKKCRLPELSPKGECRSCGSNQTNVSSLSISMESLSLDDSEENEGEDSLSKQQAEYLHQLYDLRDEYKVKHIDFTDINEGIDRIWSCSDKTWDKLKPKMDQFLVHLKSS